MGREWNREEREFFESVAAYRSAEQLLVHVASTPFDVPFYSQAVTLAKAYYDSLADDGVDIDIDLRRFVMDAVAHYRGDPWGNFRFLAYVAAQREKERQKDDVSAP